MRKNMYESAVIINAALDDAQIEAVVTKIQDTIQLNGGVISVLDKWGRKRLAYMINKSKIGYYVIFRFEAPTEAIAKLERVYRLEESIIRFLTIALDKYAIEYFKDQDAAASVKVEETSETTPVTAAVSESAKS
ncbi:MAG TPA: 30S ribosomal protein S6 [Ignavibacteriaceae bacterium]|nr:30S ribosomal protein S6 [Ignavibacteriaceae bacterium]